MNNQFPSFHDFFQSLWGYKPFKWQTELADRLFSGNAPDIVSMPTAAGKTAFIDAWLWALAKSIHIHGKDRVVQLRLFFVVDRKIVVDSAYDRAYDILNRLSSNSELAVVRDVLLGQTQSDKCFDVVRMRGGIPWSKSTWCSSLENPMVVCGTVDQIGSRLLMRGYGVSRKMRSIQAGIIGNDSILVLDEAHLSNAFSETLKNLKEFHMNKGCVHGIPPFISVEMTATPKSNHAGDILVCNVDNSETSLFMRVCNKKMVFVNAKSKGWKGSKLSSEMVKEALKAMKQLNCDESPSTVIAIIANTVKTARSVFDLLGKESDIRKILLTGRNRPLSRESLIEQHMGNLLSNRDDDTGSERELLFVIATQCIEAGADFDFDFMVTECAPLDSLIQRFGRVNRIGRKDNSKLRGVILGCEDLTFYGNGTSKTFRLLEKLSNNDGGIVDFSPKSISDVMNELSIADKDELNAPANPALMLTENLVRELERTTNGNSQMIPSLLHGKPDTAEVFLLWRSDIPILGDSVSKQTLFNAQRIVRWLPPQAGEMLSIPLSVAKRFLSGVNIEFVSDVEGLSDNDLGEKNSSKGSKRISALLCKRGSSGLVNLELVDPDLMNLQPGSILLLHSDSGGCDEFGWNPSSSKVLDIGFDKNMKVLRLHPSLVDSHDMSENTDWKSLAKQVAPDFPITNADVKFYDESNPSDGICLFAKNRPHIQKYDTDSVDLEKHCKDVADEVGRSSDVLGMSEKDKKILTTSALWHDAGKSEVRFQTMLGRISENMPLLARSGRQDRVDASTLREISGIAVGERHEFWSVVIARKILLNSTESADLDTILWLIGTHHGNARILPEPPKQIPANAASPVNINMHGSSECVDELDSMLDIGFGWPDYWHSNREKYGVWGLAFMESMLRFADMKTAKKEYNNE